MRPAFCFSAAPLRLREEEGHSAFWFKLFCAMTTLQGATAFKGTLQPTTPHSLSYRLHIKELSECHWMPQFNTKNEFSKNFAIFSALNTLHAK